MPAPSPHPRGRHAAAAALLAGALLLPAGARAWAPAAAAVAAAGPAADGGTLRQEGHTRRLPALAPLILLRPEGVGLAAWGDFPVLHDGLVAHVNDALFVEAGVVSTWWHDGPYWDDGRNGWSLTVAGGVLWEFYLSRAWSAFAAVKLGVVYGYAPYDLGWVTPLVDLGAQYALSDAVRLRLQLGFPGGLGVGLSVALGG